MAVRFLFNLPQSVQVAALVLGGAIAAALLVIGWRRRTALLAWARNRPRPLLLGMLAVLAVAIAGTAAAGAWTWNYTQHSNAFCTGCHVMGPAYRRFAVSQHRQLECHDCHQQPVTASLRQFYLWVAERPGEIGQHAKVPNQVCAACHVTEAPERWQRIVATAGHRLHLQSDSGVLGGMQCVTCHGVEVHQFAPVSKTCGQAGCHPDATLKLAGMTDTTTFHCVACHQFTAELPAMGGRDAAAGALRPGETQCMACHQMFPAMTGFHSAADPHGGQCASCHNPHTQKAVSEAGRSCTACHSDWREKSFHQEAQHLGFITRCTRCHEPHVWKADGSDCVTCHERAAARR